jgi:hypothetical protein
LFTPAAISGALTARYRFLQIFQIENIAMFFIWQASAALQSIAANIQQLEVMGGVSDPSRFFADKAVAAVAGRAMGV